jgi:hypothetical protein
MDDADGCLCGLTFELTPTAEVGRLARVVQHKPAHRAGKTARRSGSGAERGVRPQCGDAQSEGLRLFLLTQMLKTLLEWWRKPCFRVRKAF